MTESSTYFFALLPLKVVTSGTQVGYSTWTGVQYCWNCKLSQSRASVWSHFICSFLTGTVWIYCTVGCCFPVCTVVFFYPFISYIVKAEVKFWKCCYTGWFMSITAFCFLNWISLCLCCLYSWTQKPVTSWMTYRSNSTMFWMSWAAPSETRQYLT